jgi:L-ascorbate metabolism protein UlaG (beta-lactamase superfamily)
MKIKYLGHSAFEFEVKNEKILIDPFLIGVPNYKPEDISDIFVTHGHADHLGSAIDISKSTGAKINAIFELANYCARKGAIVNDLGLGAWRDYSWGRAILVPAFHSSSTPDGQYAGCPCGVILDIEGRIIYHAGDTCLNSEMKVIGELYEPDIAMLPIGGKYTMDIEHAVIASQWLGVTGVIPMHYNTFDAIKVDIEEFERQIRKLGKIPGIMKISNTGEGWSWEEFGNN